MNKVRGFLRALILMAIVVFAVIFVITNYSWVFAKKVKGEVVDVQRVTAPTAVFGNRATEAQMYSYSVLLKGEDGELYTSASEDRQWQVVKKGYCVDALLYRYPPWHFDKGNNFFNARVEKIRVCPGQSALPDEPSSAAPTIAPAGGANGLENPPPESGTQPSTH